MVALINKYEMILKDFVDYYFIFSMKKIRVKLKEKLTSYNLY